MFDHIVNLNNVSHIIYQTDLPTVEECIAQYMDEFECIYTKYITILLDHTLFEYHDGEVKIIGEIVLRQ